MTLSSIYIVPERPCTNLSALCHKMFKSKNVIILIFFSGKVLIFQARGLTWIYSTLFCLDSNMEIITLDLELGRGIADFRVSFS